MTSSSEADALSTMMGTGARLMISRMASMPLLPGMRMSIVTTSGRRAMAMATASCASPASPTISTWRSSRRIRLSTSRKVRESSTMRHLITIYL